MPDYSKLIELRKWELENQPKSLMDVATPLITSTIKTLGANRKATIEEQNKLKREQMLETQKSKAQFVQKILTQSGQEIYKIENGQEVNPSVEDYINTYQAVMQNGQLPSNIKTRPKSDVSDQPIYMYDKKTGALTKQPQTFKGKSPEFIGVGTTTQTSEERGDIAEAVERGKLRGRGETDNLFEEENPYAEDYPDAFLENGQWKVIKEGNKYIIEE